jgi:preprotein translocase subunit SecD
MWKNRIIVLSILLVAFLLGFFIFKSEPRLNKNYSNTSSFFTGLPFRLGLDLSGGTHLVYKADVSMVREGEVDQSMEALRDVIERRVNLFGVSEPLVQVQKSGFVSGGEERLIVDLPNVTDVKKAVEMIGETPLLEFKIENTTQEGLSYSVNENGELEPDFDNMFLPTDLSGKYLKQAVLEFDQNTNQPMVSLQFDTEGKELFAEITKNNIGKIVAIYLDGAPISTPVVREAILDGQAVISGNFTPNEAKQLVGRLNSGALPVPISLISTQTIGASLGEGAISDGIKAGILGFIILALYLVLWYRLLGIASVFSLGVYVLLVLFLFKLIPVTLTASGIAGFIISLGIAVDANVLIFERIKEELRNGYSVKDAIKSGFSRAWLSIRDSNISSLLTATILFWFGTSLIQGFALTFGLGVLVSMVVALFVLKAFLSCLGNLRENKVVRFLFSSGFSK